MDLAQLRSDVRTITGYPEQGTTGDTRLNNIITLALRQLWREVPERLLSEVYRMQTEPYFETNTVRIHSSDRRVWQIANTPTALTASSLVPEERRGRWLEVARSGAYHYFRVQDLFFDGQTSLWHIVVDKPWDNLTDSGLSYRLHTPEYPYPSWVRKVREVYYDPEGQRRWVLPMAHRQLDRFRHGAGFRQTGEPEFYARGEFYQLRPPHYTPTITTIADPQPAQRWGNDSNGVQQAGYGTAGTFSYRVVHVLGRRLHDERLLLWRDTGVGGNPDQQIVGLPFYMSAPSPASAQQATTWGGTYIQVNTPNVDYVYGFGADSTLPSYNRAGIEKWIFRARHATNNTGSAATVQDIEADGIYYLWRVIDGDTVATIDRGDSDPPVRDFPLERITGYHHLRFDRMPSTQRTMYLNVVRRPETLSYDTDTARVPPEFEQVLLDLVCSYVVGRRDGAPARESAYFLAYLEHLRRLREEESFAEHEQMAFGDGLGAGDPIFWTWPREPITEIT